MSYLCLNDPMPTVASGILQEEHANDYGDPATTFNSTTLLDTTDIPNPNTSMKENDDTSNSCTDEEEGSGCVGNTTNDESSLSSANNGVTVTSSPTKQHTQHIRKLALLFYYFWHGFQEELPATALYLVLKEQYALDPSQYSLLDGLVWLPWALKPLFGYISDRYPIRGLRRTPYLVIGLAFNFLCWLFLSLLSYDGSPSFFSSSSSIFVVATKAMASKQVYMILLFSEAISAVIAETAADTLLVELAQTESDAEFGSLQSLTWTIDAAGSVIGSSIPIIAFYYNWKPFSILFLNAIAVGLSSFCLPFLREDAIPTMEVTTTTTTTLVTTIAQQQTIPSSSSLHQASPFSLRQHFCNNPILLKALLFVFIVSSSPTSGDIFTYFQTDILLFSPSFLSWTSIISTISYFVAASLYAKYMRQLNMKTVFTITILFSVVFNLINIIVVQRWNIYYLNIPDKAFIMGDTLIQGILSEVIFMPVAILAAKMAPVGSEGVMYATTMSVLNLSWACSELFSSICTKIFNVHAPEYNHLSQLIICISCLSLLPLFFLSWIPERSDLDNFSRSSSSDSSSSCPETTGHVNYNSNNITAVGTTPEEVGGGLGLYEPLLSGYNNGDDNHDTTNSS